jgi:hypothetical protein
MHRSASFAALLPLFASCAAFGNEELGELAVRRSPDLKLTVEPVLSGLQPEEGQRPQVAGSADDMQLEIMVYMVERDVLEAARKNGTNLVSASTCDVGELDSWLNELKRRNGGELAPIGEHGGLRLGQDSRGFVRAASQAAFVRGYELTQRGTCVLADPQVDVATDGFLLDATLAKDSSADSMSVAFEFTVCQLDRPFRERDVWFADSASPMRVQHPTGVTWRLSVNETLAADEALVITGRPALAEDADRGLLVIARRVAASTTPDAAQQAR